MKKFKFLSVVLTTSLVASIFAGCSGKVLYDGETVTTQSAEENREPVFVPVNITFDLNCNELSLYDSVVSDDGFVQKPVDPTRESYTFDGWCLDRRGRLPYDFETKLTKDTTLYAKWNEVYAEDEIIPHYVENTAIGTFTADVRDVLVGQSATVTFFAEIVSQDFIENEEIAVYSGSEKITVLNDDGIGGDVAADDGIFSGSVALSSDETSVVRYTAEFDGMVSDPYEICFYEEITAEDYGIAQQIGNAVYAMDDIDSVVSYVSSHDSIKNYAKSDDGKSVIFRTDAGMTFVWNEPVEENVFAATYNAAPTVAGAHHLVTSSSGNTYASATAALNNVELQAAFDEKDVCVINTTVSQFGFVDSTTVGLLVANELGGDLDVYEDEEVTVDLMKNLDGYGMVIIQAHGTSANFTNAAWTIWSNTPYIVTGDTMTAFDAEFSADWWSERIIVCNDYMGGFIGGGTVAVGGGFFNHYYDNNELDGTAIFMSCCGGLATDALANSWLSKGAEVVYGFNDTCYTEYYVDTLYEVVLNNLLLDSSTAMEAYNAAVGVCGASDPNNANNHLNIRGDGNYRLVGETGFIAGVVQDFNKVQENSYDSAIKNATVEFVSRTNGRVQTTRTDSEGRFKKRLSVDSYDVRVYAYSYLDESVSNIEVDADITTYMEDAILLHPTDETTKVSGKIINALTGEAISGAAIRFRHGYNSTDGDYLTYANGDVVMITSGVDGAYVFDKLPRGYYTAEVTVENFVTSYRNIVATGIELVQDITITPMLSNEEIRVVLTWGLTPSDLDSHMKGPGGAYTWYRKKSYYKDGERIQELDVDDVTSYGPETTTIYDIQPGIYKFYVHNYSRSPSITTSGAQVKVYQGGRQIAVYNLPTDQGSGLYWNVFTYDSTTGVITPVNTITSSPT